MNKGSTAERSNARTASGGCRLERVDWVNAALQVLADRGIAGVRIESLARDLGVTKGSFYWHFKDRDALLAELLQVWRRRATLTVMERLESRSADPVERLKGLLRFPFASPRAADGADIELAIRLWGRNDERARAVLAEIDELRIRFIASIFAELGFDRAEAEARAALIYGFMRVGLSLPLVHDREVIAEHIGAALTGPSPHSA